MSGRVVTLKTKAKPRAHKGGTAPSVQDIVQILRERIARHDVAPGAKLGEQEFGKCLMLCCNKGSVSAHETRANKKPAGRRAFV